MLFNIMNEEFLEYMNDKIKFQIYLLSYLLYT